MEWKFSEFNEFREYDKSLKHELGSCLLHVSCWHCGSTLVSNTRGGRFEPFIPVMTNNFSH